MPNAKQIKEKLKSLANNEQALKSKSFVKMSSYGKHCHFLGVDTPCLRLIAKDCKELALGELSLLLSAKYQEEKFIALVCLVGKYKKAKSEEEQESLFQFYVDHFPFINNWHLVDLSAPYIMGPYFSKRDKKFLYECLEAKSLWVRRISILSNWWFIRKENNLSEVFKMSERLFNDPEDLIHKAVGWMLKEAYRVEPEKTIKFISTHRLSMPRTMLRYALKEYPSHLKKEFMSVKL